MEDFRRLLVWQRAFRLAVRINHLTHVLPAHERQSLGDQMRHAARSVHANIAEACGRKRPGGSNADSLRFFSDASGSLHELDSDAEYCREVGYWPRADADEILAEIEAVRRMLASLIAHRRKHNTPTRRT